MSKLKCYGMYECIAVCVKVSIMVVVGAEI